MAMPKLTEEAVFNVARLIDAPKARQLYLQQACGDDLQLLARVEALLRVHEQQKSFLEPPAGKCSGISPSTAGPRARRPTP